MGRLASDFSKGTLQQPPCRLCPRAPKMRHTRWTVRAERWEARCQADACPARPPQATFLDTTSFNGDLSRWDVSKVTTLFVRRCSRPADSARARP